MQAGIVLSCFLKMTFESIQVCFSYLLPVMNVLSHVPRDYLKSLLIYRLTPSRKSHSFPPIKGTSKTKINIMCGRISQRDEFKVKAQNFREKICKVYKKKAERLQRGKKWINKVYAKAGNQPRHILFKPLDSLVRVEFQWL